MSADKISIDRLRPGLFIRIDLPWLEHPFLRNRFKLKGGDHIAALREAGIREVAIERDRSDPAALAALDAATAPPPAPVTAPAEQDARWAEKRARIEQVRELRERLQGSEKAFQQSLESVKSLMRDLTAQPKAAIEQSEKLVGELAAAFLNDRDIALNLMNVKGHEENLYFHALNVAVLSMMLGAAFGLGEEELNTLGQGALFHDIGKLRIPDKVLRKTGEWTKAEQAIYELHPRYGRELMERLGVVSPKVLAIIEQHHEAMDGRGFPQKLSFNGIAPLSRMVAVVNAYDNLCNPRDPAEARSPAEALAYLYARQRSRFDETLLSLFVRVLGVYPPGSIVRLSDGQLGMVVSADAKEALRPTVLVYDPNVPRKEAIILDLRQETDLQVSETLPPSRLTPEVYAYLSPHTRISYFIDGPRPA